MSGLAWVSLGYVLVGLLVATPGVHLQRKASGAPIRVADALLMAVLWPISLFDFGRLVRARRATYVPPFAKRYERVLNYLQQLEESADIDANQVQRLETAYRELSAIERQTSEAMHGYVQLERGEDVLFLFDDSPARIVIETTKRRGKHAEEMKQARENGILVNLGLPVRIVVSGRFHASFHELPLEVRKSVIKALVEIGEEIDRYAFPSVAKIRERLVMNGPLPCMIIESAAAVVIEPREFTLYIVGVLGNLRKS